MLQHGASFGESSTPPCQRTACHMNPAAQQGWEARLQLAAQAGSGGKRGIQPGLCRDTPGTTMTHCGS